MRLRTREIMLFVAAQFFPSTIEMVIVINYANGSLTDVVPFLYIDSALIASIKSFQSGARCPAYEDWYEGQRGYGSCHNSMMKNSICTIMQANWYYQTMSSALNTGPSVHTR